MTPFPQTSHGRARLEGFAWIALWIGMFVATHIPVRAIGVLHFRHADKLVHAGLYALLTILGGRRLKMSGRSVATRSLLSWGGVYAAYGVLDEWLQSYVGRSMSFSDWLADVVGISIATAWLLRARRATELSELAPPSERSV